MENYIVKANKSCTPRKSDGIHEIICSTESYEQTTPVFEGTGRGDTYLLKPRDKQALRLESLDVSHSWPVSKIHLKQSHLRRRHRWLCQT